MGIKSKSRKTYKKSGNERLDFPRLVTSWNASRPFEVVTSDTTVLKHKGKMKDLTLYIDVFNNEIVCYDLGEGKHGSNYRSHMSALQKFLNEKSKRGYKDLETFLHTDQGTIYSSRAFQEAHKDYNINRSMSRAGTPTDNPVIESLNRWIKWELYYDFRFKQSDNIDETIANYVDYFNNSRFTETLQNKTPVEYRSQLGFN
ncbi:IS3 family transposase [Mycoplasmatota bacterium WC44]